MTTTLPLWPDDIPQPAAITARTPASWIKRHGESTGGYSSGCRCEPCTEAWRDYNNLLRQGLRRCRQCNDTYAKTTGGGTKFCAECIANGVYQRHYQTLLTCARCETQYRKKGQLAWDLCPACIKHPVYERMASSFGNHRAPIALILRVLDWPYCDNEECGQWLLERKHSAKTAGGRKWRSNFTIDHDHTCCPGQASCGKCIRGVLCQQCNRALTTNHSPILHGLGHYLDRYAHANEG